MMSARIPKTRSSRSTSISLSLWKRTFWENSAALSENQLPMGTSKPKPGSACANHSIETTFAFPNICQLTTRKSLPLILKHIDVKNIKFQMMPLRWRKAFSASPSSYTRKSHFCLLGEKHHLILSVTKLFLYTPWSDLRLCLRKFWNH